MSSSPALCRTRCHICGRRMRSSCPRGPKASVTSWSRQWDVVHPLSQLTVHTARVTSSRARYGILVPPQDPEALAPAFSRIIDEADRWPAEILRARAGAFSYKACADAYRDLFRSLV